MAKTARAVTTDEKAHQNAKSYLEIEAYINSKLCNKSHQDAVCHQHIAPYLGEIKINQTLYLIWQSSGEYTLEDYIEMDDGWVQLAYDLGIPLDDDDDESSRSALHQRFAKEVLRQLLEGIAYCHSLGVIHRDIKVRMEIFVLVRFVAQSTLHPNYKLHSIRCSASQCTGRVSVILVLSL